MNDRECITAEEARAMLDYNPISGEFKWKPRLPSMFPNTTENRVKGWNFRFAGKAAGYTRADGYVIIRINGIGFFAHRLAILITKGQWPAVEIDHVNGDPSDNSLRNLREASRAENAQNFGAQSGNTSGHRGVHWCNTRNKWIAKIHVLGRVKNLGQFDLKEDACAAYLKGKADIHTFQPTPREHRNEQAAY